jgi:hypothetical protein
MVQLDYAGLQQVHEWQQLILVSYPLSAQLIPGARPLLFIPLPLCITSLSMLVSQLSPSVFIMATCCDEVMQRQRQVFGWTAEPW